VSMDQLELIGDWMCITTADGRVLLRRSSIIAAWIQGHSVYVKTCVGDEYRIGCADAAEARRVQDCVMQEVA